ncbi:MAG: hypothetical protein H7836_17385, partial [Magnetococcus sp. YQC-3]
MTISSNTTGVISDEDKKYVVLTFVLGTKVADRSFNTATECDNYVREALQYGLVMSQGKKKADLMIDNDEVNIYICQPGFALYDDIFTREAMGEPYGAQTG